MTDSDDLRQRLYEKLAELERAREVYEYRRVRASNDFLDLDLAEQHSAAWARLRDEASYASIQLRSVLGDDGPDEVDLAKREADRLTGIEQYQVESR